MLRSMKAELENIDSSYVILLVVCSDSLVSWKEYLEPCNWITPTLLNYTADEYHPLQLKSQPNK